MAEFLREVFYRMKDLIENVKHAVKLSVSNLQKAGFDDVMRAGPTKFWSDPIELELLANDKARVIFQKEIEQRKRKRSHKKER